jgi:hypothetical protein
VTHKLETSSQIFEDDLVNPEDKSDFDRLAAFYRLQATSDFHEAIDVIEALRFGLLGHGSLTINVNITPHAGPGETIVLQRLWSNSPAASLHGRKRKEPNEWTERVLRRCEIVATEGVARIQETFDDHKDLFAAHVRSIVNYPLSESGRCVATLNLMSEKHHWTPKEIGDGALLALIARPAIVSAAWALLQKLKRGELH